MWIATYNLILELHKWIQSCITFCLEQRIDREEEIWMWILAVIPFLQLLLPFIKDQLSIHALLLYNMYIILKSWALQFSSFSEILSYISSTLL